MNYFVSNAREQVKKKIFIHTAYTFFFFTVQTTNEKNEGENEKKVKNTNFSLGRGHRRKFELFFPLYTTDKLHVSKQVNNHKNNLVF